MTVKERETHIKELISTLTTKEEKILVFINQKDTPLKKSVKIIKVQGNR